MPSKLPTHRAKARLKHPGERRPNAGRRGYGSTWRKNAAMKQRRKPLCEVCLREGKVVAGVIVHHIIPLKQDRSQAYVQENLMNVCRKCHAKLTREEKRDG